MKIIIVIFIFLLGCSNNIPIKNPEKRVALVIGNQNYPTKKLANPINDAKEITKILKKLNFDVIYLTDVSQKKFNLALEKFKSKIDPNTLTFFYFSGHGNTIHKNSTETFLIMVEQNRDVWVSIHKLYEVLNQAGARNNIISIDACQDYKKGKNNKDSKGLYRTGYKVINYEDGTINLKKIIDDKYSYKRPPSTIISYSAEPNEKAKDSGLKDPKMSPYAYYLVKYLDNESIPIAEVFRRVRKGMLNDFKGTQRNSETNGLKENIWLQPAKAMPSPAPTT